ncbi:MAG: Phosphodiesterase I [Bacteroidetes bacterium OLB9]|nr:MAG: Phosphodiesterase I [Bacteroidetes bacterium OLB9]
MKRYAFLFFWMFFGHLIIGQIPVDTTQHIIPGRKNDAAAMARPYVILISADGFRYDYIEKYNAIHLKHLAQNGTWAKKGMRPSYPSITFPNHYTIATGLYPAHHGIVDNVFYDPGRDEMYIIGRESIKDGSWYGGLPLWGLAEKQNVVSASLFWVGSESDAGGMRPTYYYSYHEMFDGDDKARIIKDWLQMDEEIRPHFITLYFPEVDKNGHKYGPEAPETMAAIHYVDESIGKLVAALEPLQLPISYVFVSDHGMIGVDPKDYIPLPEIDKDKYKVINSNTITHITAVNEADIMPLYHQLKASKPKDYNVYLAKDMPRRLHYSTREDKTRRIGDIILVPKGSKIMVDPIRKPSIGKHGFDWCAVPEMKATFIAWGDAFKSGKTIKSFENIHIYPMIAELLGLSVLEPIDGDAKVLHKIFKKSSNIVMQMIVSKTPQMRQAR